MSIWSLKLALNSYPLFVVHVLKLSLGSNMIVNSPLTGSLLAPGIPLFCPPIT